MLPDLASIKLGAPAHRALKAAGIETVEQLAKHTKAELLSLHGFGPKALGILQDVLNKHGLAFWEEPELKP